jgi:hypothetical protein
MQEKLVYMKLNLATEIAPILTIFFQISLESDVIVFDICFTGFGTALTTILPILFQYCYKYCYSDSRNL